jgi:hypothetical protein
VPSLNNLGGAFFASAVDRAVLYMNALLGFGTALAPVLVAVFLGIGWWGLPLIVALLLAVLLVVSSGLPLRVAGEAVGGGTADPARLLPFVAAVTLGLAALLPRGDGLAGVLVFGLAGLGCSALLALTISFGQHDLVTVGAAVSGLLIAAYQVGYGIAAFGFGPLQDVFGVGLAATFASRPAWRS